MIELLAILITGALGVGLPFAVAKLFEIRLFTKDDGYDAEFIEGYILGDDDNY